MFGVWSHVCVVQPYSVDIKVDAPGPCTMRRILGYFLIARFSPPGLGAIAKH